MVVADGGPRWGGVGVADGFVSEVHHFLLSEGTHWNIAEDIHGQVNLDHLGGCPRGRRVRVFIVCGRKRALGILIGALRQ